MSEAMVPVNYGGPDNKTPGFDAVRAKYGEEMVTRFKNWPRVARVAELAQGWPDPDEWSVDKYGTESHALADKKNLREHFERVDHEARRNVERAARDRDYALEQAAMIVRAEVPRDQWAVVPTVAQLQAWFYDEDPGARSRAWAEENPEWGQGRSKT